MAISRTVQKDLQNNCGMLDGNRPGQYRLDFAEINYGGKSHPIELYTQRIYIFEDINAAGVTGWIELMDVDNLISGYFKDHAIIGQEILKLKFRTHGSHLPVDFVKHPMMIHKVENLQTAAENPNSGSVATQRYRLHFCSPELLNNDRIRVSQAYEDTYSNIVKHILEKHLKTKKKVWLEPTDGIHKVVIPNMHPFDAINMIMQDCRSKDFELMPNYNFYETSKGYRFKSKFAGSTERTTRGGGGAARGNIMSGDISGLNTDWQMRYAIEPTRTSGNYVKEMSTAKSFKYIRLGDTYSAIKDGMFASKSIEHDTFNKTYHITAASYLTHSKNKHAVVLPSVASSIVSRPHIIEGSVYIPVDEKFPPQEPFEKSETFTEFPDSRINFYSTGTKHAHDFITKDGSVKSNDAGPNQLQFNLRQMQQKHDSYFEMQLKVHGLSGLQVGDAFSLDVPLVGAKTDSRGNPMPSDPRFSNDTFYIGRLVHHIELSGDQPYYECIADINPMKAGRSKLPSNGDFSSEHDGGEFYAGLLWRTKERNEEAD